MHEFKVWAPRPHKVSVQIGVAEQARLYPMEGPDAHGFWRVAVEESGPGSDYGYVLDDDQQAWPDPRSRWQPNGVHGLSRVYDQSAFQWRDHTWQGPPLTGAIIYEMHIGTFTREGTFDSAITKLNELANLGITHIELMPVAAFAGDRGWGYDGVALFAVTENYGGPEALKRFVDACHATGLAVLLDVVYNHFGPVGNYTGKYGPYVTDRHITPWGDAMNFEEAGSDEVRRFFCDNALMWMRDFHFDGLRLDAVHEFMDRSALHFMEQLSAEVDIASATLGRRLVLIAESDLNDPRIVTPREARGYGFDAQWSDDFHHALFTILYTDEAGKGYYDDFGTMDKLVKSLKDIFVYDGIYSKYRKRHHGRPIVGLSAHHFIGFIQNHDQIGNRAIGDRLEHIIGLDKAKVAAGIVLTSPYVPMIFQGEEFAASTPFQYFADHEDEEMAKLVSAGRKKEFSAFGWDDGQIPDPEDRETFQRSKLDWKEAHQDHHADMLDWFTKLIHIRRASPSLNDGDTAHTQISFEPDGRWLVMDRGLIKVLTNLGSKLAEFDVPEGFRLIAQSNLAIQLEGGKVQLPPNTLAILSAEEAPE
jgi:maltooligosyltrehalose trehalohydrolase